MIGLLTQPNIRDLDLKYIKKLEIGDQKMKKWQEKRNYRRIKDEHGMIIKNIITVDGVDVDVSEEVFLAYSQMERRERYIAEEVEPGKLLSLEKLIEDNVPLELLGIEPEESAEDIALNQMEQAEIDSKDCLISALSELNPSEEQLIRALFFEGISAREYAKQLGVHLNAIQYRRGKVLKKLHRKIFL